MDTRLRHHFRDFEIKAWHDMCPGDIVTRFHDVHSALRFLTDLMHSGPLAMATLREVATRSLWVRSLYRYSDHEVLQQLAGQLVAGWLCLVPIERPERSPSAGGRGPSPVLEESRDDRPAMPWRPPPSRQPVTSWITFEVIDDETGAPVAGVKLRIKGPNVAVGIYTTDADGIVHLTDLPAGTCDIEQVLDSEAFEIVQFD